MAQRTLGVASKANQARLQGGIQKRRHLWSSRCPGSADSVVIINLRRWMVSTFERRPFEHCRTTCVQGCSGVTEPTQKNNWPSSLASCFCSVRTVSKKCKPPAGSASEPPPWAWSAFARGATKGAGGKEFPFFLDNGGAKAPLNTSSKHAAHFAI